MATNGLEPGCDDQLKRSLVAALRSASLVRAADLVERPGTILQERPLDLLRYHRIVLVSRVTGPRPESLYAGFAPGGEGWVLTGWPQHFVELGKADGVVIGSTGDALLWATSFLETTRTMQEIFYLVSSVDDVQFLTHSNPEETSRVAAATSRLQDVIQAARATQVGDQFVVTIHAMRESTVERHELTITRGGDIEDRITIVESGLPVVYSIRN